MLLKQPICLLAFICAALSAAIDTSLQAQGADSPTALTCSPVFFLIEKISIL
jgi:hypothetical protein